MRIGMGYDVHRLTEGRKLILGGVEIPYEKGLLGHSDADVLIHAVMDALLGAAALGDIGKHFPDTDEKYRGISSIILLKQVGALLEESCFVIENIDATVIAQRPKLLPYMEQMRTNIAAALGLEPGRVNVKATTEEGLGFTGSGEGISAQAVCLLQPLSDVIADDRMRAEPAGCPRICDGMDLTADDRMRAESAGCPRICDGMDLTADDRMRAEPAGCPRIYAGTAADPATDDSVRQSACPGCGGCVVS